MKLLRLIIYFIFGSFLFSCTSTPPPPKSEKIQVADRVAKQCADVLSKRYQFKQCGAGGQMMDEVEALFLAFYIYRPLSREEAREILLDCAHEVIESVNHCAEIQKYLLPGGFNEKSVQIQIYIQPDHQDNYYPDLGVCSYNFGSLGFCTHDPDNEYRYKTSEWETYKEAMALVEAKRVEELRSTELEERK